MSGAVPKTRRGGSPFSRGAVLAVLLIGFCAFLAMLYFIAAGDTGEPNRTGAAHASSRGLNGYAGLVELLEADGIAVNRSREIGELDTSDLLILTPPRNTDAEGLSEVLKDREYVGPTMVILPKWIASQITGEISDEDRDRLQRDWVELLDVSRVAWTEELPEPFAFADALNDREGVDQPTWGGLGLTGSLPTASARYVEATPGFDPLIIDASGNMLAFHVVGEPGTEYYENAHWTLFVVEPDLVNNYGLSDPNRAAAAIALVQEAGYGDVERVTFDLTFNGYGNSMNLLMLAFQPPFLAATLCLILAMIIIGWRAFLRFGPNAVVGPEIAFGKRRLVANGAGLVVRAKRLGLLAEPYITLIERRLARSLGIAHPDPEAIDAALAVRLPGEEPYSLRAARLHNATKPAEILRAARALSELSSKLNSKR